MNRKLFLMTTLLALTGATAIAAALPGRSAQTRLGQVLDIAPWAHSVDRADLTKSTDLSADIVAPALLIEANYPAHDLSVNPHQRVFLSIAPVGDAVPVTLFVYRQDRMTGERLYFNGRDGLLEAGDITDLFGNAHALPIWSPSIERLELLGPSGSAFGPAPILGPGHYMWVAELRDPSGTMVLRRSSAMYNVVDQTVAIITNVTADATWTADTLYILAQPIFIEAGATLTIEPGTVIFGDTGNRGTLVVAQGAKLMADGTPMNPIVMTSSNELGARSASDWGGLIINGYAPINVPGGVSQGEGDTGAYGGGANPDPDDDSGVLRYLRVEFAGIEFSPDNELNGIAFQGVGRGTVVDHVQVHFNEDDGIEMFGGTVDLKYMVLTGIADDSMDWTEGWQGRAQFVVAVQYGADADHGVEADNWEQDNDADPRAHSRIYNCTFIGSGDTGDKGDDGLKLRRGTGGDFHNWIVHGFRETGLDIDNDSTYNQANTGGLVLDNSIIAGNGAFTGQPNLKQDAEGDWQGSDTWFTQSMGANRIVDPMLADPFFNLVPDLAPMAGSPAFDANFVRSPPEDGGFFEPVDYLGAVAPGPNWTQDAWINWSKN
ncbi:MAG: hypothetical protein K8R59_17600 [Thermoanaerobaculales bacterium]|nr:hypothetical protein [Thermoanaerobaculales bacterium]